MRSDLALCSHLASAGAGAAVFTLAPEEILDWDDGPVEAVVRCRSCAGCAWLRRVGRDALQPNAQFELAAVGAEDVALYFRNRARGSCDVARARAELDAFAACTGPIERLVTLRDDTLEIVAIAAHAKPRTGRGA